MKDTIYRDDAINSIYKLKKTVIKHDVLSYRDGISDALEIVQDLPSADRPSGEWVDKAISIIDDMQREKIIDYEQAWEFRMRARMKGADDETD